MRRFFGERFLCLCVDLYLLILLLLVRDRCISRMKGDTIPHNALVTFIPLYPGDPEKPGVPLSP